MKVSYIIIYIMKIIYVKRRVGVYQFQSFFFIVVIVISILLIYTQINNERKKERKKEYEKNDEHVQWRTQCVQHSCAEDLRFWQSAFSSMEKAMNHLIFFTLSGTDYLEPPYVLYPSVNTFLWNNYRLSRQINVFSRTSAYFCSEEIGQQVYSLFHHRSPCLRLFPTTE